MQTTHNHFFNKVLLIVLAELVAILLTNTISEYVIPIQHTTFSYLVCGGFLAVVVVYIYDYFVGKRRARIKGELQELTNVALRRYDDINK